MAANLNAAQKPSPSQLTPWEFASETTQILDEDYLDLEVIDLSNFHPENPQGAPPTPQGKAAQDDLVRKTIAAFESSGFIAVTGHGLTPEELHHQFNLGKLFCDDVPDEEKYRLHCRHAQEGSWAGYKPMGYFKRRNGAKDMQETFDFYPHTAVESRLPEAVKPYVTDFRKFIEHNHYVILRKILGLISLGLDMEVDTLWKLHHRGDANDSRILHGGPDEEIIWRHSKDHLRYGMYNPPTEEDRQKTNKLWLPGHTDLGSITFIYSQPVAGLQVLMPGGEYQYVRHYPNHILVNFGDLMEFVTGGVLKAWPHRVLEPPSDQRHLRRLGLFYFVPFLPEVPLTPLDHPSLHDLGATDMFQGYLNLGGQPLTSGEWIDRRAKLVGAKITISPGAEEKKQSADELLLEIHTRYYI